MRKILASLVLVSASMSMAASGQLFVDGRADHVSFTPNDATGKANYEAFQLSRFKVDYQLKASDANFVRIRFDGLANTSVGPTLRDRATPLIDLAYITHKFSDMASLTMGKLVSGIGGYEASISPGDLYLRSTAGNEVAAIYYPVGAQAEFTFADTQKIKLNFANNTQDVTSTTGPTTTLNQTRALSGLAYWGKFMDNNLIATASYHMEDFVRTTGVKAKNTYSNIGGKFIIGDIEIEADVLDNKYDIDPQAATNVLDTMTALALVRFNMADLGSFHVKYEDTKQKIASGVSGDTTTKYTGLTAAFEYKPVKDENWRMHLA
jgi:hypothetical protein